jgi:hypothetical protein
MLMQPEETEQGARLDAEFNYVIGRTALRDVVVDGEVIVRAHSEVSAADAAGALAAGVLEELAFAVGGGDPSKTAIHAAAEDVDYESSSADPEDGPGSER